MLVFECKSISLENTFGCGQNFRWRLQPDGSYAGNINGKSVRAQAHPGGFVLHGANKEDEIFWRHYFDLDNDYDVLLHDIMDEHLSSAMENCCGIRLLNQPFYETLCSFIISANNNIGRITGIVERFCAIAPADANGLHAFPTPQMVVDAGEEWLKSIGAGYRAGYLWDTACKMAQGFDEQALVGMDYPVACETVRQFKGVGEKVADCVLLFSCGQRAAFPVDTWVEKILTQWYGMTGTRSQLKKQAMARFGKHGGIAQQYLFMYAMQKKL